MNNIGACVKETGGLSMKERSVFRLSMSVLMVVGFVTSPVEVPTPDGSESHCVLSVVDQTDDGEFIMSDPLCFDREESVDEWLATGRFSDSSLFGSPAALSSFTLGKHFDGFNGSGSSITIVGSSCTGGWWNTSTWWDNRISSSYNGCARLEHWNNPNKSGASESTYGAGTTDNLGLMNNRAESVSYHSS